MKRALVIYRCGADAEVLVPEGDPEALERKRRELADRDCPYCSGDHRTEGADLYVGDGGIDLWRWRDVTPPGNDQADGHFPVGAEQGAPRLLPGEEP